MVMSSGQRTSVLSEALCGLSLLGVAVAVLSYTWQAPTRFGSPSVLGVVAEMCTEKSAPGPRSPTLHVRTPIRMLQPPTAGVTDQVTPGDVGSGSDRTTSLA